MPVAYDTEPATGFRGGDHAAAHPGMSRAPEHDTPTTIELIRPERMIVRDLDEAPPLILSGTALLLMLAAIGFTLIRARMVPRPSRTH